MATTRRAGPVRAKHATGTETTIDKISLARKATLQQVYNTYRIPVVKEGLADLTITASVKPLSEVGKQKRLFLWTACLSKSQYTKGYLLKRPENCRL